MKLTYGMAAYDDVKGVIMTAQDLLIHHRDYVHEIVVVDNNPTSKKGAATAKYCRSADHDSLRVRYVPLDQPKGTSPPRNAVFDNSKGEYTVCLDSHVKLMPGGARVLSEFVASRNGTTDLIQGPMYYNNLQGHETHLEDIWRGGTWGTWCRAWEAPNGMLFTVHSEPNGAYTYHAYPTRNAIEPEHIGLPAGLTVYDGHNALRDYGCTMPRKPFPIWGMGLGAFCSKTDAWLRFHPDFRGFGAEEGYIHEKYRLHGRQVWCVPGFGWWHCFERDTEDGKPPYKKYATVLAKVKNFVLGHTELGIPLDRCRAHMVDEKKFPAAEFDNILNIECTDCAANRIARQMAGEPEPAPTPPAPVTTRDDMHANLRNGPPDAVAYVDRLRELAATCDTVTCAADSVTAIIPLSFAKRLHVWTETIPAVCLSLRKLGATVQHFRTPRPADLVYVKAGADYEEAARVSKRYLVVQGCDADEHKPGLWAFLERHREYTVIEYPREHGGLCIMSKAEADKKPLPSWDEAAQNFGAAMFRWLKSGFSTVPPETLRIRLQTCDLCPSRNGDRCGECSCPIQKKATLGSEKCPLSRW